MFTAMLSLAIASGVLLFFIGLLAPRRADPIQTRLTTYAVRPRTLEEIELQQPFIERVVTPIFVRVARIVTNRTPQKTIEEIRHDLMVAGNPHNLMVNDFLGIKGLCAVILAGFVLFITIIGGMPILYRLLGAPIMGVLGFYLPNFWLKSRIKARKKEIQLALPDCLDLLVISVEAGLGFDGAMQKVCDKWQNELTREFARVIAETRLGKHRREALKAMADRAEVPDVTSFIGAVVQADQLGVSIGRILVIQAEQMRIKRRQKAEKLAHEAPIKMLIPMALFMLPTVYLVILGPMVPKLFTMFGGK